MYVLKNAWKSIIRNKGRNILLGVVVLVIATAACIALSIRQAAETAKTDALSDLSVTATIGYDRSSATREMASSSPSESGGKPSMDLSQLQSQSLTLDQYLEYASALPSGSSYYYDLTASLDASGSLTKYSTTSSSSSATSSTTDFSSGMPSDAPTDGQQTLGGSSFVSMGDFTLTGYSGYDAMTSLFGSDGTCSITSGSMFDEGTDDAVCVISSELAELNGLSVGSTLTLANPNDSSETYSLTVVGIYTNSASSASRFSASDPANDIYLSYGSLESIIEQSAAAGNTYADTEGNVASAALTSEVNFTYALPSADAYDSFSSAVDAMGLPDNYSVSSTNLDSVEQSLTPLETLSSIAGWFFLIVVIVGAVVLVVISMFNVRERKYEIGVLTAIGMSKPKVAAQFVCELFTITLSAILIGSAIGAAASVPITNALLANQIESSESKSSAVLQNFGGKDTSTDSGTSPTGGGSAPSSTTLGRTQVSYVSSVSSAMDVTVLLELIGMGVLLTVVASGVAVIAVMRYDPLQILSDRT